jgi:hypothetical protein
MEVTVRQLGQEAAHRILIDLDETLGAWRSRVSATTGATGPFRLICDGRELVNEAAAMRDVGEGAVAVQGSVVWLVEAPTSTAQSSVESSQSVLNAGLGAVHLSEGEASKGEAPTASEAVAPGGEGAVAATTTSEAAQGAAVQSSRPPPRPD